jgi:hypothetical protein
MHSLCEMMGWLFGGPTARRQLGKVFRQRLNRSDRDGDKVMVQWHHIKRRAQARSQGPNHDSHKFEAQGTQYSHIDGVSLLVLTKMISLS